MEQEPADGQPDRPGGLIGAVENVLRLLRLFEDHEMIRVNQVARDMGLSRSTVHRMLATLHHHQFVEQDDISRAYRPGPVLVDIGLAVVSKLDLVQLSHSALVDLRDRTGETAHVGIVRDGVNILYLDSVESQQVVRVGSRVGRILPAHATAAGKAMLAERTDAEVAALYPGGIPAGPTPRALTSVAGLLEQLAEVRRLGYAVNFGESESDVAAVAVPVRDKRGHLRCALVVTGPLSRVDDAWVKTAAVAALQVARDLGERVG
jgi:IclR family transcriptional regulator, acetate operon repressor